MDRNTSIAIDEFIEEKDYASALKYLKIDIRETAIKESVKRIKRKRRKKRN